MEKLNLQKNTVNYYLEHSSTVISNFTKLWWQWLIVIIVIIITIIILIIIIMLYLQYRYVITPRSVSNIFMNFDDLNEYATLSFTKLIKYYLGKDDKYKELHPQT